MAGAKFFDEESRLKPLGLIVGFGLRDCADEAVLEFLEQQLGVVDVFDDLEELTGDLGLLREARGVVECLDQLILLRDGSRAQNDEVALLRRHFEMRVALEELLGVVPPLLPILSGDDRAGDDSFDLIGCRGVVVAQEHGS